MTAPKETAARLRVVGGTDAEPEIAPDPAPVKPKKRKPRPSMTDQLKRFKCTSCSEEIGAEYHQMVQVLRDPHEANGKQIAGSLWWACARCLKPYYLIRTYGSKK